MLDKLQPTDVGNPISSNFVYNVLMLEELSTLTQPLGVGSNRWHLLALCSNLPGSIEIYLEQQEKIEEDTQIIDSTSSFLIKINGGYKEHKKGDGWWCWWCWCSKVGSISTGPIYFMISMLKGNVHFSIIFTKWIQQVLNYYWVINRNPKINCVITQKLLNKKDSKFKWGRRLMVTLQYDCRRLIR